MSRTAVDLFVEDHAHEEFLASLVRRLSNEEGRPVSVHVGSGRGGHGGALSEFQQYQCLVLRAGTPLPDAFVVAIDANCQGYQNRRRTLEADVLAEFQDRVVFACPDPHVERWFMADPESFAQVVGAEPQRGAAKCEQGRYKKALLDAIREGGHVPTLEGIEFARDLVDAMDLYRAGKNEPSLGSFIADMRAILHRLSLGRASEAS